MRTCSMLLEATDGRISAAADTEPKEDPFILYEDDSTHMHTQLTRALWVQNKDELTF